MVDLDFTTDLTTTLKGKSGDVEIAQVVSDNDVIGVYFSADWCPPCKRFTPKLCAWYNEKKTKGKKIEVIFVSSDRDEDSFNSYFAKMADWLALPFNEKGKGQAIKQKFRVRGIPTFILFDKSGKVLTQDGRSMVESNGFPQ